MDFKEKDKMKSKDIIEILESEMVERKEELHNNKERYGTTEGLTRHLETSRWLNRLRVLKKKMEK